MSKFQEPTANLRFIVREHRAGLDIFEERVLQQEWVNPVTQRDREWRDVPLDEKAHQKWNT